MSCNALRLTRRFVPSASPAWRFRRSMATVSPWTHAERTAHEPRSDGLHKVTLSHIESVNDSIRLLRLTPELPHTLSHHPGQWVDLIIPSLSKPGGFTISSSPSTLSRPNPYLELAIQSSTKNPAAAFFYPPSRPPSSLVGSQFLVRIGGSFIFPPFSLPPSSVKRVVFVAGGVGINPLISMLSSIAEQLQRGRLQWLEVQFLYSFKSPPSGDVLFLQRLEETFREPSVAQNGALKLFSTGGKIPEGAPECTPRRITEDDIETALGAVGDRAGTVVYVCGVKEMTDRFVESAGRMEGMSPDRVFSEKWW